MRKCSPILGLILLIAAFGCVAPKHRAGTIEPTNPTIAGGELPLVSLIELIANPQKWDGKVVLIVGYLNLQFEGDAIYLHAEDYESGITKNGVWVNAPFEMKTSWQSVNHRYVIGKGPFQREGKRPYGPL